MGSYHTAENLIDMNESSNSAESEANIKFRKMADRFIDTANRQLNDTDPATVNSSFLYGASRFCAFVTAQKTGSLERFDEMHEEALKYYTDEFRNMLKQNLEHYRASFEQETRGS
jgi:hypothetical protein